jgi:hypothetical protein
MSDNRRPTLWARMPDEEMPGVERVAHVHYDGNLSLLIRTAVRKLVAEHEVQDAIALMRAQQSRTLAELAAAS